MAHDIHIIGGGLAGSEAAWQLAEAGYRVRLSEMRGGGDMTPAHQGDTLAEMVCSNSFRSDDGDSNAVGLLHREMRTLGSIIMREADVHKVPAGSALAVDRDLFSGGVTQALSQHPNISIVRERIDTLPSEGLTIVATGPLTGAALADSIGTATGKDALAFFDAIAPIVYRDSVDMDVAWMASRSVTAAEKPSRSTASAEPAGTLCASAAAMISEPSPRISAWSSPTALLAASSERKLFEQTSSASPSVWCAGVISPVPRISERRTLRPASASCQAASEPARPPPTICTW